MISSISSIEIIDVVRFGKSKGCKAKTPGYLDLKIFSCITDAAVYPNGIETLLTNGLSTFPIKRKPVFSNASRGLPPDMLHKENVV